MNWEVINNPNVVVKQNYDIEKKYNSIDIVAWIEVIFPTDNDL